LLATVSCAREQLWLAKGTACKLFGMFQGEFAPNGCSGMIPGAPNGRRCDSLCIHWWHAHAAAVCCLLTTDGETPRLRAQVKQCVPVPAPARKGNILMCLAPFRGAAASCL
jgi:hypothetical protein